MEKLLYTLDEVSRLTGWSVSGLRKLVYQGDIRTVRLGRRPMVPKAELERVLGQKLENPGVGAGER